MNSRSKLAAAALGATAAAAPTVVAATTYIVRPGDTLSAIAARHGTTVSALASANGIPDPDRIRIGQLLRIPDTAAGLPGYTAGLRTSIATPSSAVTTSPASAAATASTSPPSPGPTG